MRLFRRGDDTSGSDFWDWWATGRDRIATAIASAAIDNRLVGEISGAVRTIDPSMAWELAPGKTAQHAFCLSSEGNPKLRQAALRWLAAAPAPDAVWEYHASKQADASLRTLQIGPSRIDLAEMRAISSWDASHRRLDVSLWHPTFPDLPGQARLQVAFVFLDSLLGEDEVERWIGKIDVLEGPTGGRTPDELRAELEQHVSRPGDAATWILGEARDQAGQPMIVLADAALKRIDHPFRDQHVAIAIVLDDGQMPDDALASELNAEEDDLIARLGEAAVYAGRTTVPGRRTMHFVTEDIEQMKPAIDAWAEKLPPRRIKVQPKVDMTWNFQKELGP